MIIRALSSSERRVPNEQSSDPEGSSNLELRVYGVARIMLGKLKARRVMAIFPRSVLDDEMLREWLDCNEPARGILRNSTIISSERSMRILVIPREGRRPLFYYEPTLEEPTAKAESHHGPRPRPTGFRAWLGRCVERARHLEHHVPARLQSPIAWLKSRLPADERLLMSLRNADRIVFAHPTTLSFQELKFSWNGYLESRFQRRMIWFVLYLLILVPSIMLAMIPGPNIIGYWVTYRLVAHAMVLYSLIRASRNRILLESEKTELLDGPIFTNRKEAERVQSQFHLFGLKKQLRRARVWQRLRRRRKPRWVASSPIEESR